MTHTVTIGRDSFAATCPVPQIRLSLAEAIGLTLRGWWDRAATRNVPDHAPTHTLWGLQSVHRQREEEVDRLVDLALSAVDHAIADIDVVIGTPLPDEQPVPTSAELEALQGADRIAWARTVRASVAANKAHAQAVAELAEARRRRAQLLSIREALGIEAADVRRQWEDAYLRRAARYTRARFALRGSGSAPTPQVAGYLHSPGPTVERRGVL